MSFWVNNWSLKDRISIIIMVHFKNHTYYVGIHNAIWWQAGSGLSDGQPKEHHANDQRLCDDCVCRVVLCACDVCTMYVCVCALCALFGWDNFWLIFLPTLNALWYFWRGR